MSKNAAEFDKFWQYAILPSLKICSQQMDKEFQRRANVFAYNDNTYKEELRKIYKDKREWLKKEYLPNEKEPKLDFHKLSSICCRIMIGLKAFSFDVGEATCVCDAIANDDTMSQLDKVRWQIDNIYVNYKVAFLVAEGIIFLDLIFWAQKKINSITKVLKKSSIRSDAENNIDEFKKLELMRDIYLELIAILNDEQKSLYHYEPSVSHDDFMISSIIALMKNDSLMRDFDYLQFSISMFQWQEYTKKQHLYDILRKKNFLFELADLTDDNSDFNDKM